MNPSNNGQTLYFDNQLSLLALPAMTFLLTMILFDAFSASLLSKRKKEKSCSYKLQVQKLEHGRHPIKKLHERSQDSNEDYRLLGDYNEESSKESIRKPSVKRIVQHSIENHEVKHQSSSDVIDKIFSKDYSKLF